jgi:hypothetical protein
MKYYARQMPKIFPQGLYEESATQLLPLGVEWKLADGRTFVYSKNAASNGPTGPGYLASAPVADPHQQACAVLAAAIGDTHVHITNGADTQVANFYKEGYISVDDDAGEGQLLKIKSHPAMTNGGTTAFELYDEVRIAWTVLTTVSIFKHPFDSVVICPADTPVSPCVGVSNITPTASYYFWLQKAGMASVLVDNSTLAIGANVEANGAVAGSCQVETTGSVLQRIGRVFYIGVSAEKAAIWLNVL